MAFLVIDGLQVPVALNQSSRADRVTAGEITEMFDGSLQSSARGVARVWDIPTHPLPMTTARALEGLAAGLRRVRVWGDAIDTDSAAPVLAYIRLDRLRLGNYADGERRAFAVTVTEAEPWSKALNWEGGFPALGTFSRASVATYLDGDGILQDAASGEARTGHYVTDDVSGLSVPGWLLERARTPGWSFPEAIDNAVWTKAGTVVTANARVAPDGTTTMDQVLESGSTIRGYGIQRQPPTMTDNATQAVSFWVYPSGRTWLRLVSTNKAGTTVASYFDMTNKVVGTLGSGHGVRLIEEDAYGNLRIGFTFNAGSGGSTPQVFILGTTGDGVATHAGAGLGIYLWGVQFEADAAFATSYMDTTARVADLTVRAVPTSIVSKRTPFFRYTKWKPGMTGNGGITSPRLWHMSATAGGDLYLRWTGATTLRLTLGGTDLTVSGLSIGPANTVEAGLRWNGDGTGTLVIAVDGTIVATATLAFSAPSGDWVSTAINSDVAGTNTGAMTLLRDYFIPRRLSGDAERLLNFARHF